MTNIFQGSATALITPFSHGEPDLDAMGRIIDFQISEKTSALVVCGTTGEVSTLSGDERRRLIEYTVERCAGRVPVIAGTGGNNTESVCEMSHFAASVGADAVLSVAPYYNKGTKNGIIEHYEKIADACKLPVIVYNVPSRTGVNLTPDDYDKLSRVCGIAAIKESNSKPESWLSTMRLCNGRLTLYSGNDSDTLPIISVGGRGVISVASNVVPGRIADMCRAALIGDVSGARAICLECSELFQVLFSEVNPVPVKYAMHRLGFCKNELRLPLTPCEVSTAEKLDTVLSRLGLL